LERAQPVVGDEHARRLGAEDTTGDVDHAGQLARGEIGRALEQRDQRIAR
jgi:hypothetical protein